MGSHNVTLLYNVWCRRAGADGVQRPGARAAERGRRRGVRDQRSSNAYPAHQASDAAITEADFAYRISALADDRFEGRGPASEHGEQAATWIAEEMDAIGLEPAGEERGWYQPVPLIESTLDETASSFDITIDGEPMGLQTNVDVVYWSQNPEEQVSLSDSDLVFVGYGVVAPEYGWNDYEGVDVTGKTVVILINDPGFADPDSGLFNGSAMTYYGRWTYKYEEAARQGAEGAIIVHQTAPAAIPGARCSRAGPARNSPSPPPPVRNAPMSRPGSLKRKRPSCSTRSISTSQS